MNADYQDFKNKDITEKIINNKVINWLRCRFIEFLNPDLSAKICVLLTYPCNQKERLSDEYLRVYSFYLRVIVFGKRFFYPVQSTEIISQPAVFFSFPDCVRLFFYVFLPHGIS